MNGQSTPSRLDSVTGGAGATIAAVATAMGRCGIAVVRVSGAQAAAIAEKCVTPWPLVPRRATHGNVRDHGGGVVDQALITWFPAPRSFTGEDVLEVSCHGGDVAPEAVLAAIVRAGARPATAGEFTRRAVLNGKLDLLRAEAIGDLVDAPSGLLHRAALAQLSGALTVRIAELRDALLEVDALLAYDIDFPEEDDGPVTRERIASAANDVQTAIGRLLSTLPVARLGRNGAVVVLAGIPNAGKSSLFNALIGEARALVTEHAGTTRDAIDVFIEGSPYPWRLVDTAGLRDTADPVEQLGVEVSSQWLARADIVLLCGANIEDRQLAARVVDSRTNGVVIPVHTMADLAPGDDSAVAVSAISGGGLDSLRAAVAAALEARVPVPPQDVPVITRARHEAALEKAQREISMFRDSWQAGSLPAPVVATHLRAAVHALDVLIGAVDTEDVLDRVFARFCVGK